VASSQTVTAGQLDVHLLQQGMGEPVILLHGFPQTSHEWRHQIAALAEAGYAVFAPDNRGFGGTAKPDVRISRALLARDVVDLMDALGVERAAVVGHDWGGIIGAKLAFDRPERVSRLALLDTLPSVWSPAAVHGWWFKSEGRAEAFFADHHRTMIEVFFGGRAGTDLPGFPEGPWPRGDGSAGRPSWIDAEDLDQYLAAFADPSAWAAAIQYYRYGLPFHRLAADGTLESMSERQVAEQWEHPGGLTEHPEHPWYPVFGPEDHDRTYTGPVLWMYGRGRLRGERPQGASPPSGNPFVDQFARHYPDLRTRDAACGHFIPEEEPALTSRTLVGFLGGHL
jgi:pimeloyl-ACP methyl ester carboxylesterase